MDSQVLTQNVISPQFNKIIKTKLGEMMDSSNALFEKRLKAVNKEIESLKIDYQLQLKKFCDFLQTPGFVAQTESPKKNSILKKNSIVKNRQNKSNILETQNLCGYQGTNHSEVSTPKLSKNNNFKNDTRNFINFQNKSNFKNLKDINYLLKSTEAASASTSFYSNYNSSGLYRPSPKSKVASTSPLRTNEYNILNNLNNFSGTKVKSKNIINFYSIKDKGHPSRNKKEKSLIKSIDDNMKIQPVEERKEENDNSSIKSNNFKIKDHRRFSILDIEASSPMKIGKVEGFLYQKTNEEIEMKLRKDVFETKINNLKSSKLKVMCLLICSE
jgi:hypothetical protein